VCGAAVDTGSPFHLDRAAAGHGGSAWPSAATSSTWIPTASARRRRPHEHPSARTRPSSDLARLYQRVAAAAEDLGAAEHRTKLLEGVSGRVVVLVAGNGMNFSHYPAPVTEVVAVEPEPYLRTRAEERAQHAAVPMRVVEGAAASLPLPEASVDTGVVSLVLCSVADQAAASPSCAG